MLQGDSDVQSPRWLAAEAERVNSSRTENASHIYGSQTYILVISSLTHSPPGLIMQREDSIMEYIF